MFLRIEWLVRKGFPAKCSPVWNRQLNYENSMCPSQTGKKLAKQLLNRPIQGQWKLQGHYKGKISTIPQGIIIGNEGKATSTGLSAVLAKLSSAWRSIPWSVDLWNQHQCFHLNTGFALEGLYPQTAIDPNVDKNDCLRAQWKCHIKCSNTPQNRMVTK